MIYADTSLVVKLLLAEAESEAVKAWVDQDAVELVSSRLLETELRRVAAREDLDQQDVTQVLERISLYDVPREAFRGAGIFPDPALRSLDAIHLTVATMIGAAAIATYDERMTTAASRIGLPVLLPEVSPGA